MGDVGKEHGVALYLWALSSPESVTLESYKNVAQVFFSTTGCSVISDVDPDCMVGQAASNRNEGCCWNLLALKTCVDIPLQGMFCFKPFEEVWNE